MKKYKLSWLEESRSGKRRCGNVTKVFTGDEDELHTELERIGAARIIVEVIN